MGPRSRIYLSFTLLFVLVAAGCAGPVETGDSPVFGDCEDSQELVDLLQTGLPMFDFEPSPDLATLIERSDLVVTGSLNMAVREEVSESVEESWTRIAGEAQVLHASDEAFTEQFLPDPFFVVPSFWPSSDPDPLGEPVVFENGTNRFIAFLVARAPGEPFELLVEGLHVACNSDEGALPVIADLPPDVSGSVDDIGTAVLAIVDPPPVRNEGDVMTIEHRLLAEDVAVGETSTARLLSDEDVWQIYGDDIELADDEVFFEFVLFESGTSPLGPLDRIEFDRVSQVLFPIAEVDDPDRTCIGTGGPHAIAVAIERDRLPAQMFFTDTSQFGSGQEGFGPTPVDIGDDPSE